MTMIGIHRPTAADAATTARAGRAGRSPVGARPLVATVCAVALVVSVIGTLAAPEAAGQWWVRVPLRLLMVAAVVSGGRLWLLGRRGALGPLLVAVGASYFLGDLRAAPDPALHAIGFCLAYVHTSLAMHAALTLPDGRLPDRASRVLAVLAHLSSVGTQVARYVVEGPRPAGRPQQQWAPPVQDRFLTDLGSALVVLLALVALAVLARRWRDASPAGRRPLAPAVAAAALWAVLAMVAAGSSLARLREGTTQAAVATAVACLAVAAATTAALDAARGAAARRRITDLALAGTDGDPDRLVARLQDALASALQDPGLLLLLATPAAQGACGWVDARGERLPDVPVGPGRTSTAVRDRDGTAVAVLVHDAALRWTPGLTSLAAATVGSVLRQGAAGRERAARRALQHDLHDGAQQRFAAAALLLDRAGSQLAGGPADAEAAAETVEQARVLLGEAMGTLRDLVTGAGPVEPARHGLAGAVRRLAARAPIPVEVHVAAREPQGPVATAAWFAVCEALANVYRHAHATRARIALLDQGDALVVVVEDDGRGPAAGRPQAVPAGLRARAAGVGGWVDCSARAGGGTVVRVVLPGGTP